MPLFTFGTISLLVHIIISTVFLMYKVFITPRLALPALLIVTTVGTMFYFASHAGYLVLANKSNNIYFVKESFYTCKPIERVFAERTIVLRLDDVQANAYPEATRLMIDAALDRNMPVVAGVIPEGIAGDRGMLRFLRKRLCNLEIAMHGYDHRAYTIREVGIEERVAEFEELDIFEASRRIREARRELVAISTDSVVTFIPPENRLSDGTRAAFFVNGIEILSSEGQGHYDYDASFWNYDDDQFGGADDVIEDCTATFTVESTCVIMLHPQDLIDHETLSLKPQNYAEYIKILDYFVDEGVPAITFTDMYRLKQVSTVVRDL